MGKASSRPNPSQSLWHFDFFKGNQGCSHSPLEFCDVPGILGCFSLQCPREAAQDLCPSFSFQQNCSDQNFPSIHTAPLRDSLDFSGLSSFPLFCFPGISPSPVLTPGVWGTIISCRQSEPCDLYETTQGEPPSPNLHSKTNFLDFGNPNLPSLGAEGTLVPASPSSAKPWH